MVIDIEKVKNIVKFYADEAREIMPVDLVYLYGSYAKWTATEHSDVDVRFFLTSYDGDNWDNIMIKHFILSHKYNIYIEQYMFEVSDLYTDNPFVKEVLRTSIEIK